MFSNKKNPLIEEIARAPLPTLFGDWTYIVFGDYIKGVHHEMLVFGSIVDGSLGDGENILTRAHSSCRTSESLNAINCECKGELDEAMKLIKQEGKGIIVYLEQEGRGTGISGKMAQLNGMFEWKKGSIQQKRDCVTKERIDTVKAYNNAGYPAEARDFTVAGVMLKHVGVKSVRLLTNNPKKIRGIETAGIKVVSLEIHIVPNNDIIATNLRSKAINLGHVIPEKYLMVNTNNV